MNREEIFKILLEVLSIPSPTFKEKSLSRFIKKKLSSQLVSQNYKTLSYGNSFICTPKILKKTHHMVWVGHLDVVPEFVKPNQQQGKIYGAGASDMQSSLAVFIYLFNHYFKELTLACDLSLVFYSKEEGTPVENNGLYELINKYPSWFKNLDLAIVGEPTSNHVQLGCVGSIHTQIKIKGKACHSARPWEGENALYNASPFIQKMVLEKPKAYKISGLEFKDVFQITESQTSKGITTLPSFWEANLNYRFAPRFTKAEAIKYLKLFLKEKGLVPSQYKINSFSPAGLIIENNFSKTIISILKQQGCQIKPKQAWTDVAQFTAMGIPAFNYGPGLPEKCHTADEYVLENKVWNYAQMLRKLFLKLDGIKSNA